MHADAVRELTGGLPLPGLNDVLANVCRNESRRAEEGRRRGVSDWWLVVSD